MKKTRSRIKKDPLKEIACLRGKSGWLRVSYDTLTHTYSVIVSQKDDVIRMAGIQMYPHEIARLYDFLGKVLA